MNLKEILDKHLKWLNGDSNGKKANLREADLRGADLCGAYLYCADLRGADLRGANLREANLCEANLRGADLRGANLREANLCEANLREADLREANLCEANLREANLCGADLYCADLRGADLRGAKNLDKIHWNIFTTFYPLQCPEKGSYTAFKKAEGKIVELIIPETASRSSSTSRKCRASEAYVVDITSVDGKEHFDCALSDFNSTFIYKVGETVTVNNFDNNRWNECSTGIHHFVTRDEAVKY